ncbi:MAG: xanthine dehydrogenase family protein molybdopterin-binding subunit [Acidobacteriota bacterium]
MRKPVIGAGLDRVDAHAKVTGQATYAADVPVAKVAHAVIVSSGIARGRIAAIDVTAANKLPGVLAVITPKDAPHVDANAKHGMPNERVLQLLQDDKIEYSDQPVAVVVADTLERAQHAALAVTIRYKVESPVADLVSNLGAAMPPKHPLPTGPADTQRGDVAAGLASAAHKLELVYTTPVQNHNPMEPHATIAVWQGGDRLTLYDATQYVYGVRARLAEIFGIPRENIRVIDHFVGGAFGCKGTPWSHVALAAMAAKVVARPVKLVVTRTQMFAMVGHRPKTVQTIALGCDAHGKLTAIRHDVVSETSRFDEFVEGSAQQTRMLYACPSVATSHRIVPIDIGTPTFQRAPGESTGQFALESAIDELAYLANLDPLELRLRNYAAKDLHEDKPWSSKSLRECYKAAADKFGWARRSMAPRSMRDGKELVGWGLATATYPARQLTNASARCRLRADGTALVQTASHDLGTGTYTVMTQVAADALGLPVGAITVELGDTNLPEAPISAGSMTVSSVGPAVQLACKHAIAELGKLANPGELDGDRRAAIKAILARAGQTELVAEGKTEKRPDRDPYSCHSFGAQLAEVRVDEELGRVRVARLVGAFAAGKFLNAKTARSQLMGGMVWGIGFALEEHTVRDHRTARAVSRDLVDYHVPVNADVPMIDVILIDEVDPHVNDLGAKGIGEVGLCGITAAIANAVFHATGRRVRDLPITVDKLL